MADAGLNGRFLRPDVHLLEIVVDLLAVDLRQGIGPDARSGPSAGLLRVRLCGQGFFLFLGFVRVQDHASLQEDPLGAEDLFVPQVAIVADRARGVGPRRGVGQVVRDHGHGRYAGAVRVEPREGDGVGLFRQIEFIIPHAVDLEDLRRVRILFAVFVDDGDALAGGVIGLDVLHAPGEVIERPVKRMAGRGQRELVPGPLVHDVVVGVVHPSGVAEKIIRGHRVFFGDRRHRLVVLEVGLQGVFRGGPVNDEFLFIAVTVRIISPMKTVARLGAVSLPEEGETAGHHGHVVAVRVLDETVLGDLGPKNTEGPGVLVVYVGPGLLVVGVDAVFRIEYGRQHEAQVTAGRVVLVVERDQLQPAVGVESHQVEPVMKTVQESLHVLARPGPHAALVAVGRGDQPFIVGVHRVEMTGHLFHAVIDPFQGPARMLGKLVFQVDLVKYPQDLEVGIPAVGIALEQEIGHVALPARPHEPLDVHVHVNVHAVRLGLSDKVFILLVDPDKVGARFVEVAPLIVG